LKFLKRSVVVQAGLLLLRTFAVGLATTAGPATRKQNGVRRRHKYCIMNSVVKNKIEKRNWNDTPQPQRAKDVFNHNI